MHSRVQRSLYALLVVLGSIAPVAAQEDPLDDGDDTPLVLPLPTLMGPRRGPEREKALKRGGGNVITERAVNAGLDWLARHQGDDGTWDADGFAAQCDEGAKKCEGIGKGQHGEEMPCPFDVPISALATLAFLGHGHVPGDPEDPYGAVVERALEALQGGGGPWSLALGTQALAEAEALERKGRWRDAAATGAERLLALRNEDGAWGYASGFRPGSDVPYTALVVQALVAARDAGVELPADFAPRMHRFLASLEIDKGRLAYLKDGRRYGYTPTTSNAHCAAAIRELLREGTKSSAHRAHMGVVAKRRPVWKISFKEKTVPGRGVVRVQMGHLSLYQWWYGTIATFHAGGGAWSGWWGKLKGALVGHQVKSGCARGSWDPLGTYERQTGGRVFATALAVLMLEQPYRHQRGK